MKRQRRMEAMARQRAFIDSQIQLLTVVENRVPNIIRSRTGASRAAAARLNLISPDAISSPPVVKRGTAIGTDSQHGSPHHRSHLSSSSHRKEPMIVKKEDPEPVAFSENLDMEMAGTSSCSATGPEGNFHTAETRTSVPITITEELAMLLGGAVDKLQTVQADDGTVMVVLDESNLFEYEAVDNRESEEPETLVEPSPTEATVVEEKLEELPISQEEESYVIVQTENGEVLVSKSEFTANFMTACPDNATENYDDIMQFIFPERENVEAPGSETTQNHLNTSNNAPTTGPTPAQTQSKQLPVKPSTKKFTASNVKPQKQVLKKLGPAKKKGGKAKLKPSRTPMMTSIGSPHSMDRVHTVEEKPRPFRFELPEAEDGLSGLGDSFMSVPVPIKIDSLRSENRNHEELQTVVSFNSPDGGASNKVCEDKSETRLVTCLECGTGYASEENLQNHLEEGACNSSVQCGNCLGIFPGQDAFVSHLHVCPSNGESNGMTVVYADGFFNDQENTDEANLIIKSVGSLSSSSGISGVVEQVQFQVSSPSPLLIQQEQSPSISQVVQDTSCCSKELTTEGAGASQFIVVDGSNNNVRSDQAKLSCPEEEFGRRTLNKASARASMSSDNLLSNEVDGNGNTVSIIGSQPIQSSKNDKIRPLDKNVTTEDELKVNFLSIFKQVTKSGPYSEGIQQGNI